MGESLRDTIISSFYDDDDDDLGIRLECSINIDCDRHIPKPKPVEKVATVVDTERENLIRLLQAHPEIRERLGL